MSGQAPAKPGRAGGDSPPPGVRAAWTEAEIALAAERACRIEASAEKAGNVTPTRGFSDMTHADFLASAAAVAPVLGEAGRRSVGETLLRAVEATRRVAPVNTNLGTVLLLAPLSRAAARARAPSGAAGGADPSGRAPGPPETPPGAPATRAGAARSHLLEALRESVAGVLADLDVRDAELAFEAIRLARPGGMGRVPEQDLGEPPTATLLEVMRLAAERDAVAGEYATGFRITFDVSAPLLAQALARGADPESAAAGLHLQILRRIPDTLIARKFGPSAAGQVSAGAAAALEAGPPGSAARTAAVERLDRWLRDPARRWNPGTSADLVAAALFVWLLTSGGDVARAASRAGETG